jgi:hypothetical protein
MTGVTGIHVHPAPDLIRGLWPTQEAPDQVRGGKPLSEGACHEPA